MTLLETEWKELSIPNPNRKWWQFWKLRRVIEFKYYVGRNSILDDLVWKELD